MPYRRSLVYRLGQIEDLVARLRERLADVPEGTLQLSAVRGKQRYYLADASGKKRYLGAAESDLVAQLAQRDYDKHVLDILVQEQAHIVRLLKDEASARLDEAYASMADAKKKFVTPVVESDADFFKHWEESHCKGNAVSEQEGLMTDKGDLVRSKSEVIIANTLFSEGIPYCYEAPLQLKGLGWVRPDFTVLNPRTRQEFYWEHFGMMDDPDYAVRASRRMSAYYETGPYVARHFFFTSEDRGCVLDTRKVRCRIEAFLV